MKDVYLLEYQYEDENRIYGIYDDYIKAEEDKKKKKKPDRISFNITASLEESVEPVFSFKETFMVEFVRQQDEIVKQECIKHIKDTNKQIRIFKIDEDMLEYIFDLGLAEYQKRMILKGDDNIE